MIELLLLCGSVFVAHVIWVQYSLRQLRRDLLKVAKNPRQARNLLLEDKSYRRLEK